MDGDLYFDLATGTVYVLGPIRVADLPAISSSFLGGFYAGLICHTANTSTTGTTSVFDGLENSQAMNNASHPAEQFWRSLTINGYDDWYLPASQEWDVLYRSFKAEATPTGTYSGAGYGANTGPRSSSPAVPPLCE